MGFQVQSLFIGKWMFVEISYKRVLNVRCKLINIDKNKPRGGIYENDNIVKNTDQYVH